MYVGTAFGSAKLLLRVMGLLQLLGLRRPNQWEPPTLLDSLFVSPLNLVATLIYHVVLFLRTLSLSPASSVLRPPQGRHPIRVVCISDTHEQTVDVPSGDVLIHAGDLTDSGLARDIQTQVDWLKAQPHQVKVVVAGNHDSWFDRTARFASDAETEVNLEGLIYLEGEQSVHEIHGRRLSIFGAPDIPKCGPSSFAFQYPPEKHPWLSKVPPQTDILITHTPPKHHRDIGLGCPGLLRELWRVQPRLHVFGHVHSGAGCEPVYFDDFQAAYERVLSRPLPVGPIREVVIPNAKWLDVAALVYLGVESVLWKWLMAGPGPDDRGRLMVNAAQMYRNTGKVKSRATVVDM
ncbi:Calcineurin-like phosphoesterase [Geosmithia morbida]|uniref:Calcineurin-like phosphoesterase n=1 Tax=Geosmithia morbida TaxID=1094350 RepID=A0A9P5D277_9HYPO|nr:Calcineurin-like phosphoesterase [Geosmithia morbida]KAF4119239.1 Calcineurin-like phosphoesterase [Geosmithia morbida]